MVSCRGADASDMTSRQQASLEATTIKTTSDGVKRQEKVIGIETRSCRCHGLLTRWSVRCVV